MINRKNKMFGLAMAGVMATSILPVSVMASEKLNTIEGQMNKAVIHQGKMVYSGYIDEDDDDIIRYNSGNTKFKNDKAIKSYDSDDDIEDGELTGFYGEKYAIVEDGGDEYLVDLTTGKAIEDTVEDKQDDVENSLKSKFKKVDRYTVSSTDDFTLTRAENKNFGETWYVYQANTEDTYGDKTTPVNKYFGVANEDGKYMDVNFIANLYAYSSAQSKIVKVDEFNKIDKDSKLEVHLQDVKILTQDKDYLYLLSKVEICDTNKPNEANKIATYVQKVSKKQGEQEDDAYLPKSVDSFEVADTVYDKASGDISKGAKAFTEADFVTVSDGDLLAVKVDDDEVVVSTLKLKKDKGKLNDSDNSTKYNIAVVEYEDDENQDIDSAESVTVDVDGNVWAINKGKIMQFKDNKFEVEYKCDSSFDKLVVYNSKNLVAYEEGENDSFAVVMNGTSGSDSDSNSNSNSNSNSDSDSDPNSNSNSNSNVNEENKDNNGQTNVLGQNKIGWVKDSNGIWSYYDSFGKKVTSNWVNYNGTWYYLKEDGSMATGWTQVGKTWYYMNAQGAMQTGWLNDGGTWYYLNSSGAMQTGWLNDGGTWYYLYDSGAMAHDTSVNGYVLGSNGAWIK